MTTETLDTAATREVPAGRWRDSRAITASTVIAIVAVTLLLRLIGIGRSYDVFVDEPFYVSLGRSVADGHWVPIGSGRPFLLHPPGFFYLEALWFKLFGYRHDPFQDIYSIRVLQALLAAGSAILIYFLVRHIAGRGPAVVAVAVFSIDAYVLQQNGRVMLETAAVTLALGGYLTLVRQIRTGRRSLPAAIGVGLLFGAAILTKDMAALITVLPLLAIAAFGWYGWRREAMAGAATAIAAYLLYVLVVLVSGHAKDFWEQKTNGLSRAFGTSVSTGFTADNAPSLAKQLWVQLLTFGGSYVVLAIGVVAGLWLLVRPWTPLDRILGLGTAGGLLIMAYGLALGTVEEQFLYFLAVPAIMSLATAAHRLRTRAARPAGLRRVAFSAFAVLLAVELFSWGSVHAEADDSQHRAYEWLIRNAPAGSIVAWVASQSEVTLRGSGLVTTPVGTPAEMAAKQVTYLLVLDKTVREGYAPVPAADIDWYAAHSTKVFSATGRSFGGVAIYRTTDVSLW
ncbi:ArnT family glycosyltransferase [Actinoplanes subtropicus]|uniref:ArnT family glycosyltransferase n=1 Tax=Actinoplanes subtropicus TaxID=543632 RepID=UPI0004C43180|nr:glycosyltransferase family 39 protein [Actinoplanes subtropicus]